MDQLIEELQTTILTLERLAASPKTGSEQLDELLDQLFQLKTDLVGASLNTESGPYREAASALKQAAVRVERATKEPGQIDDMMSAVSTAIGKLARLLDRLTPTE